MSTLKTINIIHPSGSTNNIVNDASGNATVGNNLYVTTNAGIGTTSPGALLEVSAANASVYSAIRMTNTTGTGTTPGAGIEWARGGTVKSSITANTFGNDYMAFNVNGNAERMRIDTSGNVGIGTSSPSAKLDVLTSINLGQNYLNVGFDAGGGSGWLGGYNATYSSSAVKTVATGALSAIFYGGNGVQFFTNSSAAAGTTASERMRIDTSGNVGIGTASPSYKLHVVGSTCYLTTASGNTEFGTTTTGSSATVSGGFQALQAQSLRIGTFASSGAYNLEFTSQNNIRVVMGAAGNFYPNVDNSITCGASGQRWSAVWAANGTIQTSDINAKTDVVDSPLGLSFIASLRPVAYKYKVGRNQVIDNPEDTDNPTIVPIAGKRQHFGLIAQEVKAALPDGIDFGGWAITDLENPNSEQGLRYDQFIAPMIKAIQEQQATITALTARVAALEAK